MLFDNLWYKHHTAQSNLGRFQPRASKKVHPKDSQPLYQNTIKNGKSFNLDADYAAAGAYSSAATMLEYAIKKDKEILAQFDYYKEN